MKLGTTATISVPKPQGGSIRWCAPEVLKRSKASKASDIYSCGMVFWEIASTKIPYEETLDNEVVGKSIKDGKKEDIPSSCPFTYGSVISRCWSDAQSRPSAVDLHKLVRKGYEQEAVQGHNSNDKMSVAIVMGKIGEGGFGSVYKATLQGVVVATKVLKEETSILEEVSISYKLMHKNVLSF